MARPRGKDNVVGVVIKGDHHAPGVRVSVSVDS